MLLSVYYEALCPDSKGFIVKQLIPAYRKVPNLIEIDFFPYGKATTHTLPDGKLDGDNSSDKCCVIKNVFFYRFAGSLKFDCQHGERECEANIIHCCAIEAIHDTPTRLNVVACMIRDNNDPQEAFQRVCVK